MTVVICLLLVVDISLTAAVLSVLAGGRDPGFSKALVRDTRSAEARITAVSQQVQGLILGELSRAMNDAEPKRRR